MIATCILMYPSFFTQQCISHLSSSWWQDLLVSFECCSHNGLYIYQIYSFMQTVDVDNSVDDWLICSFIHPTDVYYVPTTCQAFCLWSTE